MGHNIDDQLQALKQLLEAAGGTVGIDPNAPDYVKSAFIEMILNCPDKEPS